MSVTFNIPEDVLAAMPVPAEERGEYLQRELAYSLYTRNVLSLGQGAEMAGMSRIDFGLEVGRRGIPRHYTQAELEADLAYARSV